MCGIVGLFAKSPDVESRLGELLSNMLIEMTERGPDSTGVSFYRHPVGPSETKLLVYSADPDYAWEGGVHDDLKKAFGHRVQFAVHASHALTVLPVEAETAQSWFWKNHPELRVISAGTVIETYKEKGLPRDIIERFGLRAFSGTHALGHTRMATESEVTTEHSHPFSTGQDLCLVHNGSLSNHNRLRDRLRAEGIRFETDNDSEVAAGYLTWRLRQGASLEQALESALEDLDGFFTFAIGTRDGFAVIRDVIGCKPGVIAETDDWVAMASEYRAFAGLPGVEHANVWEPAPATVYSWNRSETRADH
ncbi:MAG: glutamine amidotransferase family protein [Gammaproteobacteria bacterium]|nr:glutamine amidotransferase family protein [Gammaproteobacteria bacterium]